MAYASCMRVNANDVNTNKFYLQPPYLKMRNEKKPKSVNISLCCRSWSNYIEKKSASARCYFKKLLLLALV